MHWLGMRRTNHSPPPRTGRVSIATRSADVLGATSRSNAAADASGGDDGDEAEDAAGQTVSSSSWLELPA
jgi:hypothetical protein